MNKACKQGSAWYCEECPCIFDDKNLGRFHKTKCWGSRAHDYIKAPSSNKRTCSKCQDSAFSYKQVTGKFVRPCHGPSEMEDGFQHDVLAAPDAGKYKCRRCGRETVKGSLSRLMKQLCYGKPAQTRAQARHCR